MVAGNGTACHHDEEQWKKIHIIYIESGECGCLNVWIQKQHTNRCAYNERKEQERIEIIARLQQHPDRRDGGDGDIDC